jgi:hypothetical protein
VVEVGATVIEVELVAWPTVRLAVPAEPVKFESPA